MCTNGNYLKSPRWLNDSALEINQSLPSLRVPMLQREDYLCCQVTMWTFRQKLLCFFSYLRSRFCLCAFGRSCRYGLLIEINECTTPIGCSNYCSFKKLLQLFDWILQVKMFGVLLECLFASLSHKFIQILQSFSVELLQNCLNVHPQDTAGFYWRKNEVPRYSNIMTTRKFNEKNLWRIYAQHLIRSFCFIQSSFRDGKVSLPVCVCSQVFFGRISSK